MYIKKNYFGTGDAVKKAKKILKDEINNVLEELTEYSYQEEQEIGEIDG